MMEKKCVKQTLRHAIEIFAVMFLSILMLTIGVESANAAEAKREYELTLLSCGGFPEYHSFTDEYTKLQEEILCALEARNTEIKVETNLNAEELSLVFEAAVNGAPLVDYVEEKIYIAETDGGYVIYPSYAEDDMTLMSNNYNEELNKLLGCVDSSMSDAEKCLAVHNYMVSHYEYDETYSNYTMTKLLTTGRGVCQAYADTYTYVMTKLGVKCVTVTSRDMNHAWNMVKLDGEWYHVDVTWDDPVTDAYGAVDYDFFLLSDDAISDNYHEHYGWTSSYTADSTLYDDCFWTESELWKVGMYYESGFWYYYSSSKSAVMQYEFATDTLVKYLDLDCISGDYYTIYDGFVYETTWRGGKGVILRTDIETSEWEILYQRQNDYSYSYVNFLIDDEGLKAYDPTQAFKDWEYELYDENDDELTDEYYTQKQDYIYEVTVPETIEKDEITVSVQSETGQTTITAEAPEGYTIYYAYATSASGLSNSVLFKMTSTGIMKYEEEIVCTTPTAYVAVFAVNDEGKYTNQEVVAVSNVYGGTCGDEVTWYYENGVLTISGEGAMTDYEASSAVPWHDIRKYITKVVVESGVTNIGANSFYSCSALKEAEFYLDVTSIGAYAFYGCSALESIKAGKNLTSVGMYAFRSCSALTDVYYTGSEEAWAAIDIMYRNDALEAATVHYNCSLAKVIAEGTCGENAAWTLDDLGKLEISGSGEMEDRYTYIESPWCDYESMITSVVICEGITSVGDCAFYGCANLSAAEIAESVKRIGEWAFSGCDALTSIVIPEGVEEICDYAFFACGALKSAEIPHSVTEIGEYAFYYCSALSDVYYNSSSAEWEKILIGEGNSTYFDAAAIHFAVDDDIADVYAVREDDKIKVVYETANQAYEKVIAVGYCGGALIDYAICEGTTVYISSDADSVKLFFWSSVNDMLPLREAVEISVK